MAIEATLNQSTSVDLTAISASVLGGGFSAGSLQVVQDTGQLVKLANILSPLDKPSTAKISNTRIANVYQTIAKGSIPALAQALNVSGCSVFAELNVVGSKLDSASREILLPMQCRIELKVPNDGDIDNSLLKVLALSCLNLLHNPAGPDDLRVTEIMRGVLFQES